MSEEDSDATVYEGVCNASEEQNKFPLSSVANGESEELSFSVRRPVVHILDGSSMSHEGSDPCQEQYTASEGRRELASERRVGLATEGRRELTTEGRRELATEERRKLDSERRVQLATEGRMEGRREFATEGRGELATEGRRELDTEARRELDSGERRELNTEGRKELDTEGRRKLDTEGRRELDQVDRLLKEANDSMNSVKVLLEQAETEVHKRDTVERMKVIGRLLKEAQDVSLLYAKSRGNSKQKAALARWTTAKLTGAMKEFSQMAATVREKWDQTPLSSNTTRASASSEVESTTHSSSLQKNLLRCDHPPSVPACQSSLDSLHLSSQTPVVATQPTDQAMVTQPTNQAMATQPSNQAITTQSSNQTIATKPSNQVMASQPRNQVMSTHPSDPVMITQLSKQNAAIHASTQCMTAKSNNQLMTIHSSNQVETTQLSHQVPVMASSHTTPVSASHPFKQALVSRSHPTNRAPTATSMAAYQPGKHQATTTQPQFNMATSSTGVVSQVQTSVNQYPPLLHFPPLGTDGHFVTSSSVHPGAFTDVARSESQSMVGFSEAVPLALLIQEGYLKPGDTCLSVTLMGVKFVAALLKDGTVSPRTGEQYKLPTHWVNACWEKLGHKGKKMKRAGAYKNVFYDKESLMHYCQLYNRSTVKKYLNKTSNSSNNCPLKPQQKQQQQKQQEQRQTQNETTQLTQWSSAKQLSLSKAVSLGTHNATMRPSTIQELLFECKVMVISTGELCTPQSVPVDFWTSDVDINNWPPDLIAALDWD